MRARGKVAPLTNALVSTNGLNMRDEIRRERTIELYAEGFRFDDLRRWKIAEQELNKDVKGIQWSNSPINNPAGYSVFSVQSGLIETVLTHKLKNYPLDANGSRFLIQVLIENLQLKIIYSFTIGTIKN